MFKFTRNGQLNWRGVVLAIATCYAAVAVLSLVPEAARPHLPWLSDKGEHVVVYAGLSFVTAALVGPSVALWVMFVAIVTYAGALEFAQAIVPYRNPSLNDLLASGIGAFVGIGLAGLFRPHRAVKAMIGERD